MVVACPQPEPLVWEAGTSLSLVVKEVDSQPPRACPTMLLGRACTEYEPAPLKGTRRSLVCQRTVSYELATVVLSVWALAHTAEEPTQGMAVHLVMKPLPWRRGEVYEMVALVLV